MGYVGGIEGVYRVYRGQRGYVGYIGGTWFEVAVEHGLAADVVLVGHPLGHAVLVLQGGAVDGSDQGLTEVELVDLEHSVPLP